MKIKAVIKLGDLDFKIKCTIRVDEEYIGDFSGENISIDKCLEQYQIFMYSTGVTMVASFFVDEVDDQRKSDKVEGNN